MFLTTVTKNPFHNIYIGFENFVLTPKIKIKNTTKRTITILFCFYEMLSRKVPGFHRKLKTSIKQNFQTTGVFQNVDGICLVV